MAELRWVLLALGVMLVAGIYVWGRGLFRRSERVASGRRRRNEPRIAADDEPVSDDILFAPPGADVEETSSEIESEAETAAEPATDDFATEEEPPPTPPVERVVALRLIPRALEVNAAEAVRALRDAGLEHGRYDIFHYLDDSNPSEPAFSVASLTEPGSFDLDRLDESLAGMTLFMILPGVGDPVARFDAMVETARALAHRLDADLCDDRGGAWSIQRERYIREELISYRVQSEPS